MTRRLTMAISFALLIFLALWGVRLVAWRPYELTGEVPADGYARVEGVVHIHTTLSDGGGTPEEVVGAARDAGLDYIVISDHNHVDALPYEGEHDSVLVLVGSELSTTSGHILGMGLEEEPQYRFSGDALDGLLDIRDLGGFSFAAHPFSPRHRLRFTGWDLPGPWGIELINGDSEWRRAGPRLLLTTLSYYLNPRYALLQSLNSPEEALDRWDKMLAERDVVGLYGADAHSRLPFTKSFALRVPSYEALFSLARNHILLRQPLTGQFPRDRISVLRALRQGRFYLGVDGLASARGFGFTVQSPSGQQWTMGESVPLQDGLVARAGGQVPKGSRVRLLRNGRVQVEANQMLEVPLGEAGVYRVEVRLDGWAVPWIISNPIAVFDDVTLARRERLSAWPPSAPPETAVEVIDAFEGRTVFAPGHDPASELDEPLLDATGGVDGSGGGRMAFRLGEPTAERPHVFTAIVSWEHRDLTGRKGLAFQLRADGTYRVWVQVRDENPASVNEGTEWWFASVKTSVEWRQIALPFARLRSIEPRTDGQLDLDKIRAIVFVIDKGSMKPGSRGTIWIDNVGVY